MKLRVINLNKWQDFLPFNVMCGKQWLSKTDLKDLVKTQHFKDVTKDLFNEQKEDFLHFIGAFKDREAVVFTHVFHNPLDKYIYIRGIWVDSDQRSRGIGYFFMKQIEESFIESGINNIQIEHEGERSRKFWIKCGFRDMTPSEMDNMKTVKKQIELGIPPNFDRAARMIKYLPKNKQ